MSPFYRIAYLLGLKPWEEIATLAISELPTATRVSGLQPRAMRFTSVGAGIVAMLGALSLLIGACRAPTTATSYTPGLGEIMTLTQMRHIKLWFAGEAGNWPLADYELDELEEGFADAARFHPTHKDAPRPLTQLVPEFTDPPLRELRAAVADRDKPSFEAAYDSLTAACNGCHEVAKFSFNVVVRPAANPYSDQQFEPGR